MNEHIIKKIVDRKRSKPIRREGAWRILRHDGVEVGGFETKALAMKAIAKEGWLL